MWSCCFMKGVSLDIVTQAEMIEPWRPLHEDLNRLAQGMAMAEATEQVAQEREPSNLFTACWSGPCAPWQIGPAHW